VNRAPKRLPNNQVLVLTGSVSCLVATGFLSILLSSPHLTAAPSADHSNPVLAMSSSSPEMVESHEDHTHFRIPTNFRTHFEKPRGWLLTTYTVQLGDSLWKIAAQMETDMSNLSTLNPGLVADNLIPGTSIQVVQNFQGVIHRTKPGDELVQLSAAFGLDPEVVAEVNGLSGSRSLEGNALVFLPGARPRVMLAARGEVIRRPAPVQVNPTQSGWVWPITGGRYFSEFGWREEGFHRGLDIAVPTGTPAAAVGAGVVTLAGWNGGYGYCVIIDHGNGVESLYGHASSVLVSVGQSVNAGELVIQVGSTGNSTGPHLHLEVLVNGTPVNPRDYLP